MMSMMRMMFGDNYDGNNVIMVVVEDDNVPVLSWRTGTWMEGIAQYAQSAGMRALPIDAAT